MRERELSDAEAAAGDRAIRRRILALPAYRDAGCVLVFCSMGREPDLYPVLEDALASGKIAAVPYIIGPGTMEARQIRSTGELVPGCFGIPTAPSSAPVLSPDAFDLILAPGAAFDRQGGRLGRGGGYYDRFLLRTRGMICGVARSLAVVPAVLTEPHDVRMDLVITDRETIRIPV